MFVTRSVNFGICIAIFWPSEQNRSWKALPTAVPLCQSVGNSDVPFFWSTPYTFHVLLCEGQRCYIRPKARLSPFVWLKIITQHCYQLQPYLLENMAHDNLEHVTG